MKKIFVTAECPVFERKDASSQHIDSALYGMECEVLEDDGEWAKVDMSYSYIGYVRSRALCDITRENDAFITSRVCDVLPTPEYYASPLCTLPLGAKIATEKSVRAADERFIGVYYAGKTRYIRRENIKTEKTGCLGDDVAAAALKYLGTPYRWGGKSTAGIDCSGLAFMAYYLNGIQIYRDADMGKQDKFRFISLSQAKKGDLIFYPGHVVMYLGFGEFIHSTTAFDGTVRINSFVETAENYSPNQNTEKITGVMTLNYV